MKGLKSPDTKTNLAYLKMSKDATVAEVVCTQAGEPEWIQMGSL